MPHLTCRSPLGDLTLFEEDCKIVSLDWGAVEGGEETPLLAEAVRQLDAYFDGELKDFDLPLDPHGTAFQKKLWKALQAIPYGETLTYGQLAAKIDSGPRAIGGACGRNPIPIIIPCHRVLASNGKMGGYSGLDGPDTKKILLRLEGAL
jgi:methylated-DNA-[protein]-cysteine S-methyltransferase